MSKFYKSIAATSDNSVYNIGKLLNERKEFLSRFNRYYVLFILLALIYGVLLFIIPPDASVLVKYDITAAQARMLSLSLAAPLVVIWLAAFYGFIRLKQYAGRVHPTADGKHLARIAHGLMYLAVALPVTSISSSVSNYIAADRPHLKPAAVIIHNYIGLALVFIGFYLISQGATGLVSTLKKRAQYSQREKLVMTIFLIISAFYCYLTLTNPARQFETEGIRRAAYYMADFPLVLTIVIPYLFVWFFGMRSVFYIYLYRQRVKGIIYRDALGLLAAGLATVIISSMSVRYLLSLTTILNSVSLKVLLALLYIIVFVMFAGYILIARGTKRLQRIEEV